MIDAVSLDAVRELIGASPMVLTYISRPSCGVCTALKPKIESELAAYPRIETRYVNLDEIPEAAGHFSVFSLPGILLFIDGKESIREARYVSVDELFARIDRIYTLRFSED